MQDFPETSNPRPEIPPQSQSGMIGRGHARWLSWWATLPGNARGAFWILLAAFLLTVMSALIKLVGERINVAQILLVRQGVMTVIVLPTIVRSFPSSLRAARPSLQIMRIVFAGSAMVLGFTAMIQLPLADAIAISFAKSFFITIFAIFILKEVVGIHRWSAVIIGFLGVVVMLNPNGDAFNIYGLMAVAGAAGAGIVMILIRLMSRTDRPVTILTYQALGVGLIMSFPAWYYWTQPTWQEWVLLVSIGCIGWASQMSNIQAFKAGEATAIASLDYTRLLYATALGFFIFGDWPGPQTLIGAGIIIAASLYTVHREAKRNRQLVRDLHGRGYTN